MVDFKCFAARPQLAASNAIRQRTERAREFRSPLRSDFGA